MAVTNQPGRETKKICKPAYFTNIHAVANVTNQARPAAQLKVLPLSSA